MQLGLLRPNPLAHQQYQDTVHALGITATLPMKHVVLQNNGVGS